MTMNISILRTCLWALLIPFIGSAQSVRPYPAVEILQTDTFEFVYTTFNLTSIVRFPSNADYYDIIDLGGGQKKLVYSPQNNFVGRDSILVQYAPSLYSAQEFFGFSFVVKPSLVTANTDYAVTAHNTPLVVDVLSNDHTTSGSLSISAVVIQRYGNAVIENGQIQFTPETGFSGIAQVGYNCCNDEGICATGLVNIYVQPETQPEWNDTVRIQLPKNTPKEIMLQVDGYDALLQTPSNGTLTDVTHDVVVYQPNTQFFGEDLFQISVQVGNETRTRTFILSVFNTLKDKVHAIDDVVYTHTNNPITFNVLTNDVGAFTVIYHQYIQVNTGTLVYEGNGQFTYTPNPNYRGVARFTYTLGSPLGIIVEQANVEIHIGDFNPRFPVYSLQTRAGKPLVIRYQPPVEPWDFHIVNLPQNGDAEVFVGQQTINLEAQNIQGYNLLVYTPEPGFSDDFDQIDAEYCVNGICRSIRFLIHVMPNPDPSELQCLEACVWPGDANNDGVVNVRDLLAIGYALGINGPDRADANTTWSPQFSDNWEDPWTAASLDLKHLDTDGDGLISAADTLAISESYLKTNRVTTTMQHQLTTDVDLRFLVRNPATYNNQDTLIILDILYGLESKPAYDAYGFTFEIDFADVIDVDNKNIRVNYYNDSWFSRQIPTLSMFKRLDNTIIHSGYTKTDGKGGVGHGPVGFVIVDDIEGARPPKLRALGGERFQIIVRNITVMDQYGQYQYLPDQIINVDLPSQEPVNNPITSPSMQVYPNPAVDQVTLYHTEGALIEQVDIFNVSGMPVGNQMGQQAPRMDLQVGHLPNGLYFIRTRTNTGVVTTKLEVVR